MVGVEGIADWIGREVVDRDGEKVGKLADVYFDTADDAAAYVLVKTGGLKRSHSVAPLVGATLARDYVRLDSRKETIKDAPSEDAGGRLTGVDALAVLSHYGLPGEPDLEGEERVCFQTVGAAEETERKRAELEAESARAAAGGSVVAADDRSFEDSRAPDLPEPERDTFRSEEEERPAPAFPADDDHLARLAQLERRVAALEARLDA